MNTMLRRRTSFLEILAELASDPHSELEVGLVTGSIPGQLRAVRVRSGFGLGLGFKLEVLK